jgi:hypothetical protein
MIKTTKIDRIDYLTLAKRVGDMLLCNSINEIDDTLYDNILQGNEEPEGWNEEREMPEIYQSYLIDKDGALYLINYTNEIVFYSEKLDLYVWGITHFGTGWNGVYTDIATEEAIMEAKDYKSNL